jgi:hypothetical protein
VVSATTTKQSVRYPIVVFIPATKASVLSPIVVSVR